MFKLVSKYTPSGDQPQAIDALVKGINEGKKHQVLLGATGRRDGALQRVYVSCAQR